MTFQLWLPVGLVVSLVLPAACGSCPAQPSSEAGLNAVEQQWIQVLEKRDTAGLKCILAPEFTDIGTNGLIRDRQQVVGSLANRPDYRAHLEELRILIIGDTGLVRGLNRVTDSNGHPLAALRFTDVFRYVGGRWKAVSAQETLLNENDGKKP